jgi:hypothetical protein
MTSSTTVSSTTSSTDTNAHNVTLCLAPRTGDRLPSDCNSTLGFDNCASPSVPKILSTDTCHNASLTLPNVAALYKSFVLYNRNCTNAADPSPEHADRLPASTTVFLAAFATADCRVCNTSASHPKQPCPNKVTEVACLPLSTCHPHQCCPLPGSGLVLNGSTATTAIVAPYFALAQIAAPNDTLAFIIIGACVGACCLIGCLVAFYAFVVKRKQRAALAASRSLRGRSLAPATPARPTNDERESLFAQLPDETGVPGVVTVPLRHKTAPNF